MESKQEDETSNMMDSEQTPTQETDEMAEGVDDTPAFVNPEDTVEVKVDDNDIPMDEGDDDDDNDADDADNADDNTATADGSKQTDQEIVVDMAKSKLETHTDSVYAVACHLQNDSELSILSGAGDDKAFFHRLPGATTSHQLPYNHTDSVSCVAFNMAFVGPDPKKTPKLAAVGAYDGAIVLYDPDTGAQKLKLEGPSDVEWLCFHPKGGSVLLAGSGDGTVWMFHVPLNKCLQVFVGHEQGVTAGAFTPDGKLALSASSDGTLRIWAPKTGLCKHTFRLGEAGLTCMATNGGSDGHLVLVGAEDGQVHVCHTGTKKVVAILRHFEAPANNATNNNGNNMNEGDEDAMMEFPMSVEGVGFSPANPNWCATAGVDGVLKIWDLTRDGGQCRHVCKVEAQDTDGITRLRWHPTLPVVFTATGSGKIYLWDARSGTLVQTITGHTNLINDMDIQFMSSGAAIVVSGGDDNSVRVFEIDVPTLLQQQTPA